MSPGVLSERPLLPDQIPDSAIPEDMDEINRIVEGSGNASSIDYERAQSLMIEQKVPQITPRKDDKKNRKRSLRPHEQQIIHVPFSLVDQKYTTDVVVYDQKEGIQNTHNDSLIFNSQVSTIRKSSSPNVETVKGLEHLKRSQSFSKNEGSQGHLTPKLGEETDLGHITGEAVSLAGFGSPGPFDSAYKTSDFKFTKGKRMKYQSLKFRPEFTVKNNLEKMTIGNGALLPEFTQPKQ